MKHKLPELFKEIIHEKRYPKIGNVVGMKEYVNWKHRRAELINSAELFIKRQRSD